MLVTKHERTYQVNGKFKNLYIFKTASQNDNAINS